MYKKIAVLLVLSCFVGALGDDRKIHADGKPTGHPIAEMKGKVIKIGEYTKDGVKVVEGENIKNVEDLKKFIQSQTPPGYQPLILLSGEEWCGPCKILKPKLEGPLPEKRIIFELIAGPKEKPTFANGLIASLILQQKNESEKNGSDKKGPELKLRRFNEKGQLTQAHLIFPSLWRFDNIQDLSNPDKYLTEEAVGDSKIIKWLKEPTPMIDNGAWF
jgi:thiol-disulfide isomerase/thioredoxin